MKQIVFGWRRLVCFAGDLPTRSLFEQMLLCLNLLHAETSTNMFSYNVLLSLASKIPKLIDTKHTWAHFDLPKIAFAGSNPEGWMVQDSDSFQPRKRFWFRWSTGVLQNGSHQTLSWPSMRGFWLLQMCSWFVTQKQGAFQQPLLLTWHALQLSSIFCSYTRSLTLRAHLGLGFPLFSKPAHTSPLSCFCLQDRRYLLSVLIPVGCGILGALAMVSLAYAARNCRSKYSYHPPSMPITVSTRHRQCNFLEDFKTRTKRTFGKRARPHHFRRVTIARSVTQRRFSHLPLTLSANFGHLWHWSDNWATARDFKAVLNIPNENSNVFKTFVNRLSLEKALVWGPCNKATLIWRATWISKTPTRPSFCEHFCSSRVALCANSRKEKVTRNAFLIQLLLLSDEKSLWQKWVSLFPHLFGFLMSSEKLHYKNLTQVHQICVQEKDKTASLWFWNCIFWEKKQLINFKQHLFRKKNTKQSHLSETVSDETDLKAAKMGKASSYLRQDSQVVGQKARAHGCFLPPLFCKQWLQNTIYLFVDHWKSCEKFHPLNHIMCWLLYFQPDEIAHMDKIMLIPDSSDDEV